MQEEEDLKPFKPTGTQVRGDDKGFTRTGADTEQKSVLQQLPSLCRSFPKCASSTNQTVLIKKAKLEADSA
jgi:hypothetical protein